MPEGLTRFFKSFYYAGTGFRTGLAGRNFRIHILAALIVINLGLFFRISPIEWIFVLVSISSVLSLELLNTAIEEVCNLLNRQLNLDYHDTWDPRNLGAAAVLVASIFAAVIGLIIFLPRILSFFS